MSPSFNVHESVGDAHRSRDTEQSRILPATDRLPGVSCADTTMLSYLIAVQEQTLRFVPSPQIWTPLGCDSSVPLPIRLNTVQSEYEHHTTVLVAPPEPLSYLLAIWTDNTVAIYHHPMRWYGTRINSVKFNR